MSYKAKDWWEKRILAHAHVWYELPRNDMRTACLICGKFREVSK